MKGISILITAMMILMVGVAPVNSIPNEVVLNASQVIGAPDIENAINIATSYGTQPGIVTLDSSAGDFVFTDIDRSINIFVPNLILRSENDAVIQNCADAVYFDALEEDNVTVEGITFNCDGSGIISVYPHQNVGIRDNTFNVADYVIRLENANDWEIRGNTGNASRLFPVLLIANSNNIEFSENILTAYVGVILSRANHNTVINNELHVTVYGVTIEDGSSYNRVAKNRVLDTHNAGVAVFWFSEYNRVIANRVQCAVGFTCQTVLDEASSSTNKIAGNKLVH